MAKLAKILCTPPLTELPDVQQLREKLAGLAAPTPVKVLAMNYGQTPVSVADFVAYAEGKAAAIMLVKRTIALVIGTCRDRASRRRRVGRA